MKLLLFNGQRVVTVWRPRLFQRTASTARLLWLLYIFALAYQRGLFLFPWSLGVTGFRVS